MNEIFDDFNELQKFLKAKYNRNDIQIKYIDDENEEISINSQIEYVNALDFLKSLNNHRQFKFIIKSSMDSKFIDQFDLNSIEHKLMEKPILESLSSSSSSSSSLLGWDSSSLCDLTENQNQSKIDLNAMKQYKDEAPKWFIEALNKFKSDILCEIDERINKLSKKVDDISIESSTKSEECMNKLKILSENSNKPNDDYQEFQATFICDLQVFDGESFEINEKFRKSWLLKNTSAFDWPENSCKLVNIGGDIICSERFIQIPRVSAGELFKVEVELQAPSTPGFYQSEWSLMFQDKQFDSRIWCKIVVDNKIKINTDKLLLNPVNNNFIAINDFEIDYNDNDDAEFVLIPDCFDLTKEWKPEKDCFMNEKENFSNESKQINNLMTFSAEVECIDTNVPINMIPAETQIINESNKLEMEPAIESNIYGGELKSNEIQASAPVAEQTSEINEEQQQQQVQESTDSLQSNCSSIRNSLNMKPMDRLLQMGFANRALNKRLLDKYNENLDEVINDLLSRYDNDWASHRY